MIGISFEQLILLLVLALILFGPEKLPEIAEKIGTWVAKLRQAGSDFTQQYQQVLNPPLPPPSPPQAEFYCVHCSQKMEQRFTFCPHCGLRQEEDIPLADLEPPQPICPSCGRLVEPDSLFCPFCSQILTEKVDHYSHQEPPSHLITCPHCARQLESDFFFCPGCGQPSEKSPETPKSLAP